MDYCIAADALHVDAFNGIGTAVAVGSSLPITTSDYWTVTNDQFLLQSSIKVRK